jgi:hypothetical protein
MMSEFAYGIIIGGLIGLMIGGSLGIALMAALVAGARSEERHYYHTKEE